MENYGKIQQIGTGAYGIVYKGENKIDGKIVAIKKIRFESAHEGVPLSTVRETSLLKNLKHPNIVTLLNVIPGFDSLYLIFEYLEMDLKKYIQSLPGEQKMDFELIKSFLNQITQAIKYCHSCGIMHRDLKPQNLLINTKGTIKVADFGLGRTCDVPNRQYSHEVVTLWYRAPEILLGAQLYSYAVDIWSIGCIFAEMIISQPLFQGQSEIDQLFKIFEILRTPTEEIWPGVTLLRDYKNTFPVHTDFKLFQKVINFDVFGLQLLQEMLIYNPAKRISAKRILEHPYYKNVDKTAVLTWN